MRLIFLIVHLTEYSYFLVITDSKWNAAERLVQVTDETFFGRALYSCQVHVSVDHLCRKSSVWNRIACPGKQSTCRCNHKLLRSQSIYLRKF